MKPLWFYAQDGTKTGPLPEDQILALLAAGAITPQTLLWTQGMEGWAPAGELLHVPQPPQVPIEPPPLPHPTAVPTRQRQSTDSPESSNPQQPQLKQGAVIGGWICFGIGLLCMFRSLWLAPLYTPIFLVAFVLAIVAIAQKRLVAGLALLLTTLIIPGTLAFFLGMSRTKDSLVSAGQKLEQMNESLRREPSGYNAPPQTAKALPSPQHEVPPTVGTPHNIQKTPPQLPSPAPEAIRPQQPNSAVITSTSNQVAFSELLIGQWQGSRHITDYHSNNTWGFVGGGDPIGKWTINGTVLSQLTDSGVQLGGTIVTLDAHNLVVQDTNGNLFNSKRLTSPPTSPAAAPPAPNTPKLSIAEPYSKLILGSWQERKIHTFLPDGTWTLQRYQDAPLDGEKRTWQIDGDKLTLTFPSWGTSAATSSNVSAVETILLLDLNQLVLKNEYNSIHTYVKLSTNASPQPAPNPTSPTDAQLTQTPTSSSRRPSENLPPLKSSSGTPNLPLSHPYEDGLAQADASQIIIASTKPVDINVNYKPNPTFSRDGKLLLYAKQLRDGQSTFVIKDLFTLESVDTFTPQANPEKAVFAPDANRILYQDSNGHLNIFDRIKRTEIQLPIPVNFERFDSQPVWRCEDIVTFFVTRSGASQIYDLSLETLKVMPHAYDTGDLDTFYEKFLAEFKTLTSTPIDNESAEIYQGESSPHSKKHGIEFFNPCLLVGSRDGSYARVLFNNFYSQTPFYVSRDLRHLLVLAEGRLSICYLGVRALPNKLFRIDVDVSKLSEERRKSFLEFRKNSFPFYGSIFAPLVNPLNGRQVGPNTQAFKGRVLIERWYDTFAVARTTLEVVPFGEGDIAAEISSQGDGSAFYFKDEWQVLHAQGVPKEGKASGASSEARTAASAGESGTLARKVGEGPKAEQSAPTPTDKVPGDHGAARAEGSASRPPAPPPQTVPNALFNATRNETPSFSITLSQEAPQHPASAAKDSARNFVATDDVGGTSFHGSGKVYSIPDMKKLVGRDVSDAWLYGSFVLFGRDGNTALCRAKTAWSIQDNEVHITFDQGLELPPNLPELIANGDQARFLYQQGRTDECAAFINTHPSICITFAAKKQRPIKIERATQSADGQIVVNAKSPGAFRIAEASP